MTDNTKYYLLLLAGGIVTAGLIAVSITYTVIKYGGG